MQGSGRMMDRGGRNFPAHAQQQQRGAKGVGFGGAASTQRAAAPAEKPRLPQEAYIKRQSMRWLIKQRLQQVLCPLQPQSTLSNHLLIQCTDSSVNMTQSFSVHIV